MGGVVSVRGSCGVAWRGVAVAVIRSTCSGVSYPARVRFRVSKAEERRGGRSVVETTWVILNIFLPSGVGLGLVQRFYVVLW